MKKSEEKKVPWQMTNLEALAKSFGEFTYDGVHYVMVSQPLTFYSKGEKPRYQATAIIASDDQEGEDGYRPVFTVCWEVTDEDILKYFDMLDQDKRAEADAFLRENGLDPYTAVCDFDHPYAIMASAFKYSVDELRQHYEWE